MGTHIVVRGDHTPEAAAALRWAVAEAEHRGMDVTVVQPFDRSARADLALDRDLERARRDARFRAQSWVVAVVAELDTEVPVTVSTPDAPAFEALVDAAQDAALVVLPETDQRLADRLTAACRCPVVAVTASAPAA
jgi:hypothetical protein